MNTDGNIDGALSFGTVLDTSGYEDGTQRIEELSRQTADVVENEGARMQQSFSKIGLAAAAYFSVTTLKQFADSVVEVRGEIEALEISFETLIGSKDKADALFSSIREFAVNTPMTMQSLANGAQTLLGFGIEADRVMPILQQIGDISMGDAQKFQSLTLAFSQASSTGKLMGQDFLQMVNAGFNPLAEISRTTGISIKQLKEDMENGLITVDRLHAAFASATAEGGKYHGMLDKQSKGIKGAISNLHGAVDDMMNDIGTSSQGLITGTVDMATTIVKNYEAIADVLLYLIETYGIYKAALIAVATVEKVKAEIDYETEAAALQKVIAMKAQDVAATGAEATAEAAQMTEKEAKIAAMRQEVAAYIEALKVKEGNVAVELSEANAAAYHAQKKLEAAQAEVAAARMAVEAAAQHGTQEGLEAAAVELSAAAMREKAAAAELETAQENASTLATQKDTISTQIHAATTQLDAAAQLKDAGASKVAAAAKMIAKKAQDLWNASMLSSPIFWIAAAIAGVTFLIYKLATAESAAEKAQRNLNDERERFGESLEKERQEIESCISIIQDKTQTDYDQIKAYERLKELCPEITNAYTREQLALMQLADTSEILNEKMNEQEYQHAVDELAKWEKALKECEDNLGDVANVSDETYKLLKDNNLLSDAGLGSFRAIEEMASKWGQIIDEMDDIREKVQEESIPLHQRIETQTEVVSDLQEKMDAVRDELDAAEKESETNPFSFNLFARVGLKMQYDQVKEQLNAAQGVLDNLVAQQPETYESAFNNAKKAYDDANALVEKMRKNRADYTQAEWVAAQDALKSAKSAFEKLGGEVKSASTLKNEAKKVQEALEQIAETRAEGQRKVDEAQLKILEDGKEKRLKTIELERQQTIAAIDKEQKELQKKLKEAGQSMTAEDMAMFDARRAAANELAAAQIRKTEAENAEYVAGLYQEVSEVFMTEEQRKIVAIKKTYAETRKQLQKDLEAGNLTQQQYDDLLLQNNKAEAQEIKDAWLEMYGDYYQQREALARQWETNLANIPAEYQAQARKKMVEEMSALDSDRFKNLIDWDSVFGNLDTQSIQSLRANLDRIRAYFEQNKESMSATEIKDYTEAIKRMEDEIAARNPFEAMHKSLNDIGAAKTELVNALNEVADAQRALTEAQNEYNLAEEYYNQLQAEVMNGDLAEDSEAMIGAKNLMAEAQNKLNQAEERGVKAENNVIKGRNNLTASYRNFATALKNCGSVVGDVGTKAKNLAAVFSKDLADSMEKGIDFMDEIIDAASNVINAISDVGKGAATGIEAAVEASAQGSTAAAAAGATAISTIEKASVILTVISAALQVATAIASLFNSDDAKNKQIESLQKRIDQLQWELQNQDILRFNREYLDILEQVNTTLGDSVEYVRQFNEEYKAAQAEADAAWRKYIENQDQENSEWLYLEYLRKKAVADHVLQIQSENEAVERLADSWVDVDYNTTRALGEARYESAREKIENLTKQVILLQEQLEAEQDKKNPDDDAIQDYQQQIQETAFEAANVVKDMMEEIIGSSAADIASQLGDAFIEAAAQGEDAMEAWHKKVNDIVADVIKRMMVQKFLEEPIGNLFNQMQKKWFDDSGNFNGIQAVIDSSQDFANGLNQIGTDFQSIWENLPDDLKQWFGMDEREGSQRGIATASQDSVDENNARLTTIQGHTYSLVQGMDELNGTASLILDRVTGIERNTDEANNKLDNMGNRVRNIENTIDDIQRNGIRIRG